jgi:hypothetical protein
MITRMAYWIQVLPHPRVIVLGMPPPSVLYFKALYTKKYGHVYDVVSANHYFYIHFNPDISRFQLLTPRAFASYGFLPPPQKTYPPPILVGKLSRITMEKLTLASASMSPAIL